MSVTNNGHRTQGQDGRTILCSHSLRAMRLEPEDTSVANTGQGFAKPPYQAWQAGPVLIKAGS